MHKIKRNKEGFTLIELLIVIGIIAILAAAVIITITPGERLLDAREATRESHLTALGQAAHLMVLDDEITLAAAVTDCTGAATDVVTLTGANCGGLSSSIADPISTADYQMTVSGNRVLVCTTATESAYDCVGGTSIEM